MNTPRILALPAAAAMFAALSAQPAAAIECHGPNQRVGDRWLSTPYCQDNYIGHVARTSYGIPVSNYAIRQNPSKKAEVCRFIGHDNRVNAYCQDHLPTGPRRLR